MKTIEKKYYVCEICGKTSQDAEKIKKCQETHRSINNDVTILCDYGKGCECPGSIYLTWPDGMTVTYALIRTV